jgi:hypothetical protein
MSGSRAPYARDHCGVCELVSGYGGVVSIYAAVFIWGSVQVVMATSGHVQPPQWAYLHQQLQHAVGVVTGEGLFSQLFAVCWQLPFRPVWGGGSGGRACVPAVQRPPARAALQY